MKIFALLTAALALWSFSSCASSYSDLPTGEEQQLNQPGELSGTPPPNPLDEPDETTLAPVPGQ